MLLRTTAIRQRLLLWTTVPLLLLVLVNAWMSYRSTLQTAQAAYDRLLITAAHALGDMIWLEDGVLQVTLPHAALELYSSAVPEHARESAERSPLLYRVGFLNGEFLAGEPSIPAHTGPMPSAAGAGSRLQLYDAMWQQQPMRMVALWQPVESTQGLQYVVVQVAEYASDRLAIGQRILLQTLLHQGALLALVLLVLWLASTVALRPLRQLAQTLESRSAHDLAPLPSNSPPAEMAPMVQAFNGLLTRMQQAQQRQQRFVADASHQLRTPLAVLQLHAEAGLQGDVPLREALQDVATTTRRTTRAVHQLLMWHRAQQVQAPVGTHMDLREVMHNVAIEQSPLLAHKHLTFDVQAAPTIWQGEDWLLHEILMNLLSNAIRHTPAGGALGMRLEETDAYIALTVWDTGSGLSAAMQQNLFTPFVSEASSGVGLGLTICHDLAQACGGHVTVGNRCIGTTVQGADATLWLPMRTF